MAIVLDRLASVSLCGFPWKERPYLDIVAQEEGIGWSVLAFGFLVFSEVEAWPALRAGERSRA